MTFELGKLLEKQGKFSQAKKKYETCIQMLEQKSGDNSDEQEVSLMIRRSSLASIEKELGNLSHALELFEQSLCQKKHFLGSSHTLVAIDTLNLASLYVDSVNKNRTHIAAETSEILDLDHALELVREAKQIFADNFGLNCLHVAHCLGVEGSIFQEKDDSNNALNLMEQGLKIVQDIFGDNHFECANLLNNLGTVYLQMNLDDQQISSKCISCFDTSLQLFETNFGESSFQTVSIRLNISKYYQLIEDFHNALDPLIDAQAILEHELGETHPRSIDIALDIANIYVTVENL